MTDCLCSLRFVFDGIGADELTQASEPLPLTLDSVAYLMFGGHAHLQGLFDIPSSLAIIRFSLQRVRPCLTLIAYEAVCLTDAMMCVQASVFRVYMQPHVVDIDLYLYNETSGVHVPIDRSVNFYTEDTIAKVLPVGEYSLRIIVVTPWVVGVRSP